MPLGTWRFWEGAGIDAGTFSDSIMFGFLGVWSFLLWLSLNQILEVGTCQSAVFWVLIALVWISALLLVVKIRDFRTKLRHRKLDK